LRQLLNLTLSRISAGGAQKVQDTEHNEQSLGACPGDYGSDKYAAAAQK
jgi:hypothetical protein